MLIGTFECISFPDCSITVPNSTGDITAVQALSFDQRRQLSQDVGGRDFRPV